MPRYAVLLTPLQVTVTGQSPALVFEPMFQLQLTRPCDPAVFGPKPTAVLGPDLYTTVIVH